MQPTIDSRLATSMLRYVRELMISESRRMMVEGQRLRAAAALLKCYSLTSKRWWASWIMLMFFGGPNIHNWEQSRILKKRKVLSE